LRRGGDVGNKRGLFVGVAKEKRRIETEIRPNYALKEQSKESPTC